MGSNRRERNGESTCNTQHITKVCAMGEGKERGGEGKRKKGKGRGRRHEIMG